MSVLHPYKTSSGSTSMKIWATKQGKIVGEIEKMCTKHAKKLFLPFYAEIIKIWSNFNTFDIIWKDWLEGKIFFWGEWKCSSRFLETLLSLSRGTSIMSKNVLLPDSNSRWPMCNRAELIYKCVRYNGKMSLNPWTSVEQWAWLLVLLIYVCPYLSVHK